MAKKLHVKAGDTVMVISGDDKGQTGKVLVVSPKEGKVIVEGLNKVKKHVKPRKAGDRGGIVEAEAPMLKTTLSPSRAQFPVLKAALCSSATASKRKGGGIIYA